MNPQSFVGESNYGPGTGQGTGTILAIVIAAYVICFLLIFKGPLRFWAEENKGGAYALLTFGPWVPILGWLVLR